MKVFISWSGQRSRAVADALHGWIPDVIQSVTPWFSRKDINAGARWTPEINEQLSQTKFGIICLTQDNQHAPWVLFESGALAKTIDDAHVVPYLIDIDPSEVEGPLAQFQFKRWNKEETLELLQSINEAMDKAVLEEVRLKRLFDRAWPELESAFRDIPSAESGTRTQKRTEEEILREVLELSRDNSRRLGSLSAKIDRVRLRSLRANFDRRRAELEELEREDIRVAVEQDLAMQEQARQEAAMEQDFRRQEAMDAAVEQDFRKQEALDAAAEAAMDQDDYRG